MSLLRIVFGVLIGVGVLVGLALLGRQFPTATSRIWFVFLGFGTGGLLIWLAFRDLRLGVTGGRFTRYERSVRPFHFWFFILFYALLGMFFLVVGASSILAPNLLSLR